MIPVWLRISIGAAATMFVCMGIGRFSYGPMIPALVKTGSLNAAEAGYVGAGNLLGFLVGALLALRLTRALGEACTLRLCLVVAVVCLFASIAPLGFVWLALWRCLVGVAVSIIMILCLTVVTRHAPPGRLGAATGTMFTGVGVAILLTGTTVPVLLEMSLAVTWAGLAIIGLAGAVVAFWGWRALDTVAGGSPIKTARLTPVRWSWTIAGLVTARALFTVGLIPHTLFWVDYLVRGLDRGIAFGGLQWTLFGVGAVSGTYLWGRLADRIGFRAGLTLAFLAVAAGIILPVLETAVWALALSSLVVGAQPGLTAIMGGRTHQIVGPARMAEVSRLMGLIAGIFQAVGGYGYVALFDALNSHAPVFLIGGAAMMLGGLIAWMLVERSATGDCPPGMPTPPG